MAREYAEEKRLSRKYTYSFSIKTHNSKEAKDYSYSPSMNTLWRFSLIKGNNNVYEFFNERLYELQRYMSYRGLNDSGVVIMMVGASCNYLNTNIADLLKLLKKFRHTLLYRPDMPAIRYGTANGLIGGFEVTLKDEHGEFTFDVFSCDGSLTDGFMIFKNQDIVHRYRQYNKNQIINKDILPPILNEGLAEKIIKQVISPFNNKKLKELADYYSLGLLLTGEPGNGKSMLCGYIKHLAAKNNIAIKEVTGKSLSSPSSDLRELVNMQKGIIFFDDVDVGLFSKKRNRMNSTDLLSAMDGIEKDKFCVRIFTTNESVEDIDPAFRRPGRIDEIAKICKPSIESKRKIISDYWPEEFREKFLTYPELDDKIESMSGAELNWLKNLAVHQITIHEMDEVDVDLCFEQYGDSRSGMLSKQKGKLGLG